MGVVFQANDEHLLNKPVVIKVLQEILQENPKHNEWVKKKFAEERAALAAIDHPGVVGVLDTGTIPDGKAFLVIHLSTEPPCAMRSDRSPRTLDELSRC